jgi:MGT family glycosyltransferase
VLLSLSTTLQGQADVLPRLLGGLAALPIRLLLTLGGVVAPGSVPVPDNATVRGYIPHGPVLPHMAMVVTHAGMSSVATALAAGLPMVCVPQGRDQPLNAARVDEIGAGLSLPADARGQEVADAVRTVLADDRFRAAAQRLAASAASVGHGELAADLVDAVAPALTPAD